MNVECCQKLFLHLLRTSFITFVLWFLTVVYHIDWIVEIEYIVHEILQARILEWVTLPFSRGSSQPRDQTQVSHTADRFFSAEPSGKPKNTGVGSVSLLQWLFPAQESNWCLLHCRQILYQLSYQGGPSVSHWLICRNCIILVSLEWISLDHVVWSF